MKLFNFIRKKHDQKTIIIPIARIRNIYHIEKGTVRYDCALESLIVIDHPKTPIDHETFTDDGDLTLSTLYNDLCAAYAKEIRREELSRLRVLSQKGRRP